MSRELSLRDTARLKMLTVSYSPVMFEGAIREKFEEIYRSYLLKWGHKMREKKKDLEKLFVEAVDEAIDKGLNALGESGKQMLFFHLERNCSINRHDIPKKPEVFAEGLEKIFGAGASILEKIILKNLYSRLGLKDEDKKNYTFGEYIREAAREANIELL